MTESPRSARRAGVGTHRPIKDHRHRHDRWCGHAEVLHGDHVDHLHDGEIHHACDDHVERVGVVSSVAHLPHEAHMHVHVDGCGHELVIHDDHHDFVHGKHRHATHGTHYDEH